MSEFDRDLWRAELLRIYVQELRFKSLMPKSPPLPWYRRKWNMARYRWTEFRERLGEIIAGCSVMR